MSRRWNAAALATLILAVPLVTGAASASALATSLHVYLAFRADGSLASNLKVISRTRGECRTASHISLRGDAWRCIRGNGSYDPCFSNGGRSTGSVVCALAPWSKRVVVMRLSKPLPSGNTTANPLRAEPWGIVTTAGTRCETIATGTISVAGMRVSYYCSGGAYLVGETRRAAQLWKIFQLQDERANELRDVSIASAWW